MEPGQEKYNGGNVENSVLKLMQDEVMFLRNLVVEQGNYIKTLIKNLPCGSPELKSRYQGQLDPTESRVFEDFEKQISKKE